MCYEYRRCDFHNVHQLSTLGRFGESGGGQSIIRLCGCHLLTCHDSCRGPRNGANQWLEMLTDIVQNRSQ